jgi:hypothetical protein
MITPLALLDLWRALPPEARQAGRGGGAFEIAAFARTLVTDQSPPMEVYTGREWTAVGLCSQINIANGGVPDFREPTHRPGILNAPPVEP